MDQNAKYRRKHLNYPEITMCQMIERVAAGHPEVTAMDFFGRKTSYRTFYEEIERAARALIRAGIRSGDVVTICMPNTPQGIIMFYALSRIAAVANMVHPLSAEEEITFYLNLSESRMILTLDTFSEKVEAAAAKANYPVKLITARMEDVLPPHLAIAFAAKTGRRFLKYPKTKGAVTWRAFMKSGATDRALPETTFEKDRTAAILYSGGTSGTPKGICLTDYNFNALALGTIASFGGEVGPGMKMLSCMPMFHGFGLGINLHTALVYGMTCILMPTFSDKTYADMLRKKKPNFIAGVPTIYEALLHIRELDGVDLSFLVGVFSGGDSLSVELKKKIDRFLREHGAGVQVREGYGLTECVTASCLTPRDEYREGSIGLPFPDTEYAIVRPGSDDVLPPGEEGEIILRSPTLMKGYLKNEEETKEALRLLPDGNTWLYTGDIGKMDEDGFVYFIQRAKRIIITNGYNVYPSQIENVLDGMDEIMVSCVIGVKDTRRMQRVRAYVVLKDGVPDNDETRALILSRLGKKVARYALPREILFRKELPRTLVGKADFRKLMEEAEREEERGRKDA